MEAALAWVGRIFDFLFSLLPTVYVVEATHEGVRFVWGRRVKKMSPGVHVYWPIVTRVYSLPVVKQTAALPTQFLLTQDQLPVVAAGMIRYEISDIVKALAEAWEIETIISDEACAAVREIVVGRTFDQVQSSRSKLSTVLENRLTTVLEPFGVRVLRMRLTDFSETVCLSLVGLDHWGHACEAGKEE